MSEVTAGVIENGLAPALARKLTQRIFLCAFAELSIIIILLMPAGLSKTNFELIQKNVSTQHFHSGQMQKPSSHPVASAFKIPTAAVKRAFTERTS